MPTPASEHDYRKVAHINHQPQFTQLAGHCLYNRKQRYDNPKEYIDYHEVANVEKQIDILTETGALRRAAHLLQNTEIKPRRDLL